jgi:hypothetical protein
MNSETVKQMAFEGMTLDQIGRAFGVSKRTLIRKKKIDPALNAAYEAGYAAFLVGAGRKVVKPGGGKWGADKPEQIDETLVVRDGVPVESAVIQYLARPEGRAATQNAIREALNVTEDDISEALATLILDNGEVRAVRDVRDEFRYFLTEKGAGRLGEIENANHEGFEGRRAKGIAASAGVAQPGFRAAYGDQAATK